MNHSKFSRMLSAVTSLTVLSGMLPFYQTNGILTAFADDTAAVVSESAEVGYDVSSSSVRFDLNGGSLDNESYSVSNGVAVLKDGSDGAEAPVPSAPEASNLVFAGWKNAANETPETFEEDTTYYATWNYGTAVETNSQSGLTYYLNRGFYDFMGNNGSLKTTYSKSLLDIHIRISYGIYIMCNMDKI